MRVRLMGQGAPELPPAAVGKLLKGFRIEHSFVLQHGVHEYAATRKGEMIKMEQKAERTHLEFHIPSRGLIGFRSKMLRATAGQIVMHHRYHQYEYFKGSIPERINGSIISMHPGKAVAFALDGLQDRGIFFIEPGENPDEELAKASQNPVADLISLPF